MTRAESAGGRMIVGAQVGPRRRSRRRRQRRMSLRGGGKSRRRARFPLLVEWAAPYPRARRLIALDREEEGSERLLVVLVVELVQRRTNVPSIRLMDLERHRMLALIRRHRTSNSNSITLSLHPVRSHHHRIPISKLDLLPLLPSPPPQPPQRAFLPVLAPSARSRPAVDPPPVLEHCAILVISFPPPSAIPTTQAASSRKDRSRRLCPSRRCPRCRLYRRVRGYSLATSRSSSRAMMTRRRRGRRRGGRRRVLLVLRRHRRRHPLRLLQRSNGVPKTTRGEGSTMTGIASAHAAMIVAWTWRIGRSLPRSGKRGLATTSASGCRMAVGARDRIVGARTVTVTVTDASGRGRGSETGRGKGSGNQPTTTDGRLKHLLLLPPVLATRAILTTARLTPTHDLPHARTTIATRPRRRPPVLETLETSATLATLDGPTRPTLARPPLLSILTPLHQPPTTPAERTMSPTLAMVVSRIRATSKWRAVLLPSRILRPCSSRVDHLHRSLGLRGEDRLLLAT